MRRLFYLFLLLPALLMISCSDDDDAKTENYDIKLSVHTGSTASFDIQGNNITIDWGDGQIETIDNPERISASHKYEKYGNNIDNYIITISADRLTLLALSTEISEIIDTRYNAYMDRFSVTFNSKIKSFDSSVYPNLTSAAFLYCRYFETIDLTGSPKLTNLAFVETSVSNLDLSGNPLLNFLECSNSRLTSLDLRENPELEIVVCYSNNIRSVDISKNRKLIYFHVFGNELSTLDFSNTPEIRYINIGKCNFSAEALNAVFESLPEATDGQIAAGDNPGSENCDPSIATRKGWNVAI